MLRDLRTAIRGLAHAPTFTFTAVLALALAVGANGAIFGLVDALWLRPPAVRSPGTLVRVFATTPAESEAPWSWPEFEEIRARTTSFVDVAVRGRRGAVMTAADGSQDLLLVNVVSTNFFEMLGIAAAAGRLFTPADAGSLEAAPSVVLGHEFWQTRFGGDPDTIGRTIQLGRGTASAVTVMGVLPRAFRDLEAAADRDLWMTPQTWTRIGGARVEFEQRDSRWFEMIARRRQAVTVDGADAEIGSLASAFASDHPAISAGRSARVVDDLDHRLETGGVAAKAMLGLVLLVVLITCVNVANLLLARAAARTHDMAVRLSLGAPRWRIVRELAAESVVLGSLGAAGGLIVAGWLIRLLPAVLSAPPGMRAMVAFETDLRVLVFTGTVAAVTTILFGLAPALMAARTDLVSVIRSATGASPRAGAFRRLLVVAQVATSLVLLCIAADLARSFIALERADLGFTRKPLLTLWTTFGNDRRETIEEAVRQLESLPGVTRVAVAIRAPLSLSGGGLARPVLVPGAPRDQAGAVPSVKFNAVSSNYFEVMGTRIVRGRPFDSGDTPGEATVVVSEQFVRRFLSGRDPLGSMIDVADTPHRIIGIAQDAIVNEIAEAPQPYMYLPFEHGQYGETTFIVDAQNVGATATAARASLRRVASGLEPRRTVTLAQYIDYASRTHRATAVLAAILGLVGLVLTAVGVYGVVAYRTTRRAKEIGIRMALGARTKQVRHLVMRDGLAVAAAGIAAGLPLALIATRLVGSILVGVDAWDTIAFVSASAILLLAIGVATFFPARRATRIEPTRALR